jgi:hypothetical protein
MEQHLGEIAIQRLHRKKVYSRGAHRQMNAEEFIKTIQYALSFIEFKPNTAHLDSLFRSVDLDGDNFISYEDYFRFLKEYFGSKSLAAGLVNTASVREEMQHPEKKELDIVRKYSKYEKGGEGGSGQGQGQGSKHVTSIAIKNSIINGGNGVNGGNSNSVNHQSHPGGLSNNSKAISNNFNPNNNGPNPNNNGPNPNNSNMNNPNANPFGNINISSNSHNHSGMGGSGISNFDANTIDNNSSISRDPDQNSQSTDRKRNPSNSQGGIEVTIGRPSVKTPRDVREPDLLSEQEGVVGTRIARLVMTQLKNSLISYDTGKTLRLSSEEVVKFLKVVLNFTEGNIINVMKRGNIPKERRMTYEEACKVVIGESIAKLFNDLSLPDLSKAVSVEEFVRIWDRVCSIVTQTPLIDRFEQLYRLRVARTGQLDYGELFQLISTVFAQFAFRQ